MRSYPIILSLVAFLSTLCGGLIVAGLGSLVGIITAFAAGVLVAVPLFDLIPESMHLASEVQLPFSYLMYAVALGYLSLMVLERYFSVHRVCAEGACRNIRHPKGGTYGAAELSAHSFLDGFAIGLGFAISAHTGIVVALAVICHDFSDGANTVTVMLSAGNTMKRSLRMLYLDAAAPVLGAATALVITIPEQWLALLLCFFAGSFLYLGGSDLLPKAHESNPPLQATLAGLGGFLFIFLMTLFLRI